jgi:hypothetical protein
MGVINMKFKQFLLTMIYLIQRKKREIDHIEQVKSLYPED